MRALLPVFLLLACRPEPTNPPDDEDDNYEEPVPKDTV
jgi:hypothetical protein